MRVIFVNETGCILARSPGAELAEADPVFRKAVHQALRTRTCVPFAVRPPGGAEEGPQVWGLAVPLDRLEGAGKLVAVVLPSGASGPQDSRGEGDREEVRRAVGEVVHELSRPLSAVLNYAELALADPDLPEAARTRLQRVLEHAEACREIVHRALEIGLGETGPSGPLDVNAAVRQAATSVAHLIDPSRVELALVLDPTLPPLVGCASDLASAIRNLLENAVEAVSSRPSGSPAGRVEVRTEPTPAGVRVQVRDNGPGIHPAIAERLFEPFTSTKDGGGARGLGLSLVRRIALEHQGQVTGKSLPGGGAVFILEVPISRGPATTRKPPEEVAQSAEGGPRRALLVDDDASMRQLLKAYLETLGYAATEAGDGGEGLRAAMAEDYDVVVCDVKMPTMDGLEFHQRLHAVSPQRASRVIFSSGLLPSDPAFENLRALGRPHLRKPYRLDSLKAALAAMEDNA